MVEKNKPLSLTRPMNTPYEKGSPENNIVHHKKAVTFTDLNSPLKTPHLTSLCTTIETPTANLSLNKLSLLPQKVEIPIKEETYPQPNESYR